MGLSDFGEAQQQPHSMQGFARMEPAQPTLRFCKRDLEANILGYARNVSACMVVTARARLRAGTAPLSAKMPASSS